MAVRETTGRTQTGTANGISKHNPGQNENDVSSENLDNLLRCILICHDVLRIQGKLSGSSQDELVMMEMIEDEYDAKFLMRDS